MSRPQIHSPQQLQQPQGGLILSLELGPCSLSAVILDATQRLRPVASHRVPIPSHPDFPSTVTDVLGTLDELLDWVRGINARGLPLDPTLRSHPAHAAAYRRIDAIGIATRPNNNVFITPSAASTIAALSPVADLQSQATFPAFFSFPTTLRELPPGIDSDVEQFEEEIAVRQGQDLVDAFNRAHHSQASVYQFYDAQCPPPRPPSHFDVAQPERVSRNQLRQNIAKRTAPLAVDNPVVQLFRVMSGQRRPAWTALEQQLFDSLSETARVIEMGTLIASFLTGQLLDPDPIESVMTGLFDLEAQCWDEVLVDVLATHNRTQFNPETGFGRPRPDSGIVGTVSAWLVERHYFWPSCCVMTCLPSAVTSYASFLPHHGDVGIKLGQHDHMVIPSWLPVPDTEGVTVPNPIATILQHRVAEGTSGTDGLAQDTTPRYLTLARATSAGEARKTVQKMYTNGSWAVFERLINAVCIGGSIGLDNKFFSIFHPFGKNAGIKRYELGICVAEFSDLRANARCLIEGQAMAMRALMSRMATRDSAACARAKLNDADFESPPTKPRKLDFAANERGGVGLALRFDPFDDSLAPRRILVTGAPAGNRSIVQCFTQVLGGTAVVSSARHIQPQQPPTRSQRNAQFHFGVHCPSRALLGAGYMAFAWWTVAECVRAEGQLPHRLSEGGPLLNFNSIVANALAGGPPLSTSTPRAAAHPPPAAGSPDSSMAMVPGQRSPTRSWSPQCETILDQICRRMKAEAALANAALAPISPPAVDGAPVSVGAFSSQMTPGRARSSSSPEHLSLGPVGTPLPPWFDYEATSPPLFAPFAAEGGSSSLGHSPVTGSIARLGGPAPAAWGEPPVQAPRTGGALTLTLGPVQQPRRYAAPGTGAGAGSTPSHSPTRTHAPSWTRHGSFMSLGLGRLDEGAEEEDVVGSAASTSGSGALLQGAEGGMGMDLRGLTLGEEWNRTPRPRVVPLPSALPQPQQHGEPNQDRGEEGAGGAWRMAEGARRRRRPHSMLGAVPGSGHDGPLPSGMVAAAAVSSPSPLTSTSMSTASNRHGRSFSDAPSSGSEAEATPRGSESFHDDEGAEGLARHVRSSSSPSPGQGDQQSRSGSRQSPVDQGPDRGKSCMEQREGRAAATAAPAFSPSHAQSTAARERHLRAWLQGRSPHPHPHPPAPPPAATPGHAAPSAPRLTPAQERAASASRERLLSAAQQREEEVLGLERVAQWDTDIWAVYGALVEEHVRLCGWGLALGRGVGEQ